MNDSKRVLIKQFIAHDNDEAQEKINGWCEILENQGNNILSIKVTFEGAITSLVIVYSTHRKI